MPTSGATTVSTAPGVNLAIPPIAQSSSTPASTEATVLSSEQGANNVAQSSATLSAMKPPVTTPTPTSTTTPANNNSGSNAAGSNSSAPPTSTTTPATPTSTTTPASSTTTPATPAGTTYNGKITFLNPTTDQQQEIDANQITPVMQQSLTQQGFYSVASTGTVPSWVVTGNVEQANAEAAATAATAKVNALSSQLSTLQTQTDAQTAQQIQLIKDNYNNLIAQMTTENAQRIQAVQTTGYRLGMQYSGGTGGPFGGVISAEVAAGQGRIATLNNQMQSAILAAQQAATTNNWKEYDAQVTEAQTQQSQMQSELDTLNANVSKQNEALQAQITAANVSTAISTEMQNGVTDPAQILAAVNAQGLNASADDIAGAMKDFTPDAATVSSLITKYPDAGILPSDTTAQATTKILASPSYTAAQQKAAVDTAYEQSEIAKNNSDIANSQVTSDDVAAFGASLPSYGNQSYMTPTNLEGLSTPEKSAYTAAARANNVPMISTKDGDALSTIDAAKSDLADFDTFISTAGDGGTPILPKNWLGQPEQAANVTLQNYLQTNNQLASYNTWKLSVIPVLGALKGTGSGGGGGAARLFTTIGDLFPTDTDTLPVAQSKIAAINKLLDNGAGSILGTNNASVPISSFENGGDVDPSGVSNGIDLSSGY